jgi:hypothetical protein
MNGWDEFILPEHPHIVFRPIALPIHRLHPLSWGNKKSPFSVRKKGLDIPTTPSYLPRSMVLAGVSTSIPLYTGPVAVVSSGQSLHHSR